MQEKIVVLDFGSKTTQLIARRIRELKAFCEIYPYNKFPENTDGIKGIILSGSPYSVYDKNAFDFDLTLVRKKFPLLGICYGAQWIVHKAGGKIEASKNREYGKAFFESVNTNDPLFKGFNPLAPVWMSLGDSITRLPAEFEKIALTADIPVAAFKARGEATWGVQFHPEALQTEE
ncbi:MAG TPA: gamma-glutamyl-gamma-aminobutyrate hydrolase family protein, partial [Bacteroidales bacterium]|nr:gamma-glutamyl-gamma-aminobutyrate hydrolase family protein [Bacteroidales bacterium]